MIDMQETNQENTNRKNTKITLEKIEQCISSINQYINCHDKDGNIHKKINKLSQQVKQLKEQVKDINDYLDNIDDDLDQHDNDITVIGQQNELLIHEILRQRQEFEVYIMEAYKTRIINAASVSTLTYLLVENGIINDKQFAAIMHDTITDIMNMYHKEGIDINFDEELQAWDSTQHTISKNTKTKKPKNVINLQQFKKSKLFKKQESEDEED